MRKPAEQEKETGLADTVRTAIKKVRKIERRTRPEILLHKNIPKPMHGMAPRKVLGAKWWKETKAASRKKCGGRCRACGIEEWRARGGKSLEGHEFYEIDYKKGRMTYVETVMLCNYCHCFIHSGLLRTLVEQGKVRRSKLEEVLQHGEAILAAAGLEKEEKVKGEDTEWVSWGDWRLVIGNKKFPPKFQTRRQWWAMNRRM